MFASCMTPATTAIKCNSFKYVPFQRIHITLYGVNLRVMLQS